jgi:hypothetical protein
MDYSSGYAIMEAFAEINAEKDLERAAKAFAKAGGSA